MRILQIYDKPEISCNVCRNPELCYQTCNFSGEPVILASIVITNLKWPCGYNCTHCKLHLSFQADLFTIVKPDITLNHRFKLIIYLFIWFVDTVSQKLSNNNIFTIAKRNVEGQDMLYQSLKLTNGIWCLAELKIQPGNNAVTVSNTFSDDLTLLTVFVTLVC